VPRVFSQAVKERLEVETVNRHRSTSWAKPPKLLRFVGSRPNFLRKGTPSLAAFPKPVKWFRAARFKKAKDSFFLASERDVPCLIPASGAAPRLRSPRRAL